MSLNRTSSGPTYRATPERYDLILEKLLSLAEQEGYAASAGGEKYIVPQGVHISEYIDHVESGYLYDDDGGVLYVLHLPLEDTPNETVTRCVLLTELELDRTRARHIDRRTAERRRKTRFAAFIVFATLTAAALPFVSSGKKS